MAEELARNPPAPLTTDEELAWRALARAVLVIPKVLDGELLQAQSLGLTEYSVLMNLSEQPGRSMRMSELANAVMISASGLTRVVERLTRQGLAERVKAGTDGRGQLAVLTPAGFARLEQAYRRIADDGPRQRYDYAAPAFGFTSRLVYDESGLVLDYPGIARRAG